MSDAQRVAKSNPISIEELEEVQRSAKDALRYRGSLVADPENVARYISPAANTSHPLEYSFHLVGDCRGKRVLDYGCGAGENSLILAARGADVIGVDISPDLLDVARRRMSANNQKGEFLTASAYDTGLPDNSVDIVFAAAILHHLDLTLARNEIMRVLRPGGIAILQEPVRDSRLLHLIRVYIPVCRPRAVSPGERPLMSSEIMQFCQGFRISAFRRFGLPHLALFRFCSGRKIKDAAMGLDGLLLRLFPPLKNYAGVAVLKLEKP
jgi:SAM-dependent methyltransferase